jgi:hypothetical protein
VIARYNNNEHLLLGLTREQEGVAAQVLMNLGLTLTGIRAEVLFLLGAAPFHAPESRQDTAEKQQSVPEHAREAVEAFELLIARFGRLKEHAVAATEFEIAAFVRDQQDRIERTKSCFIRLWTQQ